ncbi:hypothetical protein EDD11_008396 [Mortierella claussenii]|nr:hypothetical protein EDD11_008396 [Mortierella claussenii]
MALSPRLHKMLGKGRLEGVRPNAMFYLKMLLILVALAVQITLLAKIVVEEDYLSSSVLSTTLYLVSMAGAVVLHWFEYFNMANPSATLLVFWLFTSLISIFPTRSWIQEDPSGLSASPPLLKLLFSIISFLIFVLENIPKFNRKFLVRPNIIVIPQSNPSPEPRSNFFARVSFFWLLPLLNLGKKKTLRMDDLYSFHPKLLSYPLYLTTKAKMEADEAIALQKIKDEAVIATQSVDIAKINSKSKAKAVTKKSQINLMGTVMHTVGYSFLTAIVPRVLFLATQFVRPVLFSSLIAFTSSYSESAKRDGVVPQPAWVGFGLLIAVLSSSILSSLFDGQFQNICYSSSLKARGVLVNLIYRKALRLSSTNKQEGMGAIVNHMSTDIDKVIALFLIVHITWSSLVQIVIMMVLLYAEVQYAIFASIAVIALVLFASGVCAPSLSKTQKAMVKLSDNRMKLITELVNHIKSIKLYAWESYFADKISKVRMDQLNMLRRFFAAITVVFVFLNSIGPFSIFATLSVYSAYVTTQEHPLDVRRIFVTITLIGFLNSEEVDEENVIRGSAKDGGGFAFEIVQATFGWYTPDAIQQALERKEKEAEEKKKVDAKAAKNGKDKNDYDSKDPNLESDKEKTDAIMDEKQQRQASQQDDPVAEVSSTLDNMRDSMGPILHDIHLQIKHGSLTAVVGRVGEGKSSLVGALLGEMYKYSGTVRSYGSVAYVSQSAWILNDSVRNNILFGRPYRKEMYLNTIRACALVPDFKVLVKGDQTVIGEKGINLSGGQKQRISIARAVYADANIYILDDPLSAVDAHVDHHIFQHVLTSILASKTRILVTNGVNHLHQVDQIVVIKQGKITQDGAYKDLIQDEQGDLFRLVRESKLAASFEKESDSATVGASSSSSSACDISDDEDLSIKDTSEAADVEAISSRPDGLAKRPSYKRAESSKLKDENLELSEKDEVDEEVVGERRVGWTVYKYYFSTVGAPGLVAFVFVGVAFLAVEINTQLWLKQWGAENEVAARLNQEPAHTNQYWIMTYFAWVLASAVALSFSIAVCMTVMARKASIKLHSAMLGPLIRSPMAFFDITSSGKIVNRFSHDMNAVDVGLPIQFLNLMFIVFMTINIFGFAIAASRYFPILMVPLVAGYYWLGGFFLVSSRELTRLDLAARSPMYSHFGETLTGLVTIRAFRDADRFAVQATTLLDRSQQTAYLSNATTRWLQIILDLMSILVLSTVSLLAIVQRNSSTSDLFAIVLSQIGNLTTVMNGLMSTSCALENSIVCVERAREYAQLPSEARDVIPDSKTDANWPQHGEVVFKNYSTRYREGLDLVLKDVNVFIRGGERAGIVGRTGAGKSSVTLALFRIIEAAEGSIWIDGEDISTLGLHDLRSRLTIIPQDPFLFGDSIRLNLDPFGCHSDVELWSALESASLKAYIQTLSDGLSTTIENGGENMSLGQRQLMSLARVMLNKKTRVLCLDEATAAIDIETDNAIQRALRREFVGCTVLTIAHRINTIMDSDRILVLERGEVAEYDTPEVLMRNRGSIFWSLANQSGSA